MQNITIKYDNLLGGRQIINIEVDAKTATVGAVQNATAQQLGMNAEELAVMLEGGHLNPAKRIVDSDNVIIDVISVQQKSPYTIQLFSHDNQDLGQLTCYFLSSTTMREAKAQITAKILQEHNVSAEIQNVRASYRYDRQLWHSEQNLHDEIVEIRGVQHGTTINVTTNLVKKLASQQSTAPVEKC